MKKIYIYETPFSKSKGLIKIGETSRDSDKRILEQLNTASVIDENQLKYNLLFQTEAITNYGKTFSDKDIHNILKRNGIKELSIDGKNSTEWYYVNVDTVVHIIYLLKKGINPLEINDINRTQSFPMRPEQETAVNKTFEYFNKNSNSKFLWNAKMRFGKTFATYQLMLKMNLQRVLVVTYKPAVEDAWQKDLNNHEDFKDYIFLSREDLSSLKNFKDNKIVVFASFQDLLGKDDKNNSIIKEKHKELFELNWDLLVFDEFHYGSETQKAKELLFNDGSKSEKEIELDIEELENDETYQDIVENETEQNQVELLTENKSISYKYRLYLSGTPFKALANNEFTTNNMFNWTYLDEQREKKKWNDNPDNKNKTYKPYASLPEINMYLYNLSEYNLDNLGENNEFSLNFFFKAKGKGEKAEFLNENGVKTWLDIISGSQIFDSSLDEEEQIVFNDFPFDPKFKDSKLINNTMWSFNSVNTIDAMEKLLKEHRIFQHYEIVHIAGTDTESGINALKPVRKALETGKKVIILTAGKLTTGVSIPELDSVLFLKDTDSPETYFQTSFRAQTPLTKNINGKEEILKEKCFIFDFSPNRSLKLLVEYNERLLDEKEIKSRSKDEITTEFIKYMPVLMKNGNQMTKVSAQDILIYNAKNLTINELGTKFASSKNIKFSIKTLNQLKSNPIDYDKVNSIFEKIKKFRKHNDIKDENGKPKASEANFNKLNNSADKIEQLHTKKKKEPENKKIDNEIKDAESEFRKEAGKDRELLKTLNARIPIFMFLTDASEENLTQVLNADTDNLFKNVTGIEIEDFELLMNLGFIDKTNMDGYILKFLEFEKDNYDKYNSLKDFINNHIVDEQMKIKE